MQVMFSAPTAIRVLKKQDPAYLRKYDLSSLEHLFLAGEPLDEPTHRWISEALGKPVIDHYWQTETGWPILTAVPGIEKTPIKFGSPSFPAFGYDLQLLRETDASPAAEPTRRRVVASSRRCPRVSVHRVGRRRAFRQDLLRYLHDEAGVLDFRLGHPRQRRLLLHPRSYRRRDQRRRPSPGYARDRGSDAARIPTSPRSR